jgi:peptidoglycan/LPS O-acetylase OafA/YrhL
MSDSPVQPKQGVMMAKFSVLRQSNLQSDHYHSMLISLLRGLAALQVAAAHLRALVYPGFGTVAHPPLAFQGLAFFTGFAHLAVVVFFVLSGWLVGGSLLNKIGSPDAIKHYAIDRMTRLWIVLIPTFVTILLFALYAGWIDPTRVDLGVTGEYSAGTFIGNIVGLQTVLVPKFGGNFPLWSLANETWYYILFPIVVVLFRARTTLGRLAAVAAVLAICQLLNATILLYFSIWLLGAAFSRVRIDVGPLVRTLLLLAFLAVAVYFRMKGKTDDMGPHTLVQDTIFSLFFVLFLCSMQFRPAKRSSLLDRVDRVGQFFANFSFTLYVVHIPVLGAIVYFNQSFFERHRLSPDMPSHYLVYLGMYAAIVVVSYLFYLPFEARTQRTRQWVKRRLIGAAAGRQALNP